jgi:signal transduction histidine kinase
VNEEPFTEEDVTLLETVCAVISTALTRIRLLDEVQEQNEQLKNMGTEMQNIQETERQEISSYLHDEPLQKLAYALGRIREMDLPEDIKGLLEDVARDLRGTSASLSPEMLRSHGLMSALKWVVQDQEKRGPFRTFLEIQGIADDERLPDDIELTIYRAVQEALNNCRKHANAKSVWVKLNRTNVGLDLAIEDNGVGIKSSDESAVDEVERSPDQGLGIRGLKQRVSNLGGTLAVLPRTSRGTAFMVSIPFTSDDAKAAS